MKARFILSLLMLCAGDYAQAQIRGEPDAIARAERLLERAGGRDAWASARRFHVEERAFQADGQVATLRISRDLETGNRLLERVAGDSRLVEWLATDGGWEMRDGVRRAMPPEELAMELQGLRQEPYAIYRRLARRDPALRVALRNGNALYVYDRGERLLCWFILDGAGAVTSWANFYNGAINQHFYGPTVDMGNVNLPRWGVSATGTFRFEYVRGVLDRGEVTPPRR